MVNPVGESVTYPAEVRWTAQPLNRSFRICALESPCASSPKRSASGGSAGGKGEARTGEENRDGAHDFQPWLSIASASWLMPSRQYSW